MINNEYVNYKKEEFLHFQELATLGFILALFISFTLTYDKRLSLKGKQRLYKTSEAQKLSRFQTILVFFVAISFLYIKAKLFDL